MSLLCICMAFPQRALDRLRIGDIGFKQLSKACALLRFDVDTLAHTRIRASADRATVGGSTLHRIT